MKLDQLNEFSGLHSFIQRGTRSPLQTHSFFHSDAEILKLSETSYLALSLDIVGDEQSWGLISDPRDLGRHALETALSDLAAVAVEPKGFLQGLVIGRNHDDEFIPNILLGVNDVAQKHGLFLFGGDTASGPNFSLHLTVLGHSTTQPLSRLGMKPGDRIYSTGKPGKGNSLVAQRWMSSGNLLTNESDYLAVARLKESQIIKKYATAAIDSSDGFLNSLDILVRVNEIGIAVSPSLETLLHPLATEAQKKFQLSAWSLLAGEFGDYDLIFSIPENSTTDFEKHYNSEFSNLTTIGTAIPTNELQLKNTSGKTIAYNAATARNLYQTRTNSKTYLTEFLNLGKTLGF